MADSYTEAQPVDAPTAYSDTQASFVADVMSALSDAQSEISERNDSITKLDGIIFGDDLLSYLKIPAGHDKTRFNWARRAVEIHTDQFMGNGFQVISTYDSKDVTSATDDDEKQRLKVINKKAKGYAEQRRNICEQVVEDNGGYTMFKDLAQNASAVGTSALKTWYDEKDKKFRITAVEAVENLYVVWSDNDFRQADAYIYVYQVSLEKAIKNYGVDADTPTSPLGQPLNQTPTGNPATVSGQKMVTIIEMTGTLCGWKADKGKISSCEVGKETEMNTLIVGKMVKRVINDPKKLPHYYVLPNKRQRRRPWGVSDISIAAIDINLSYIETFSDWRTVGSKVNFPKFKAIGFGANVVIPKPKPRTIEVLPMADGQDIGLIDQGNSAAMDFKEQIDELEKEFVRETGLSRVLFSDPTITLNSNQALMTSMKPTTDIAQAKKSLWKPVLTEMFTDMLETLAAYDNDIKELTTNDDGWFLRVVWPDYIAKYDPSAFSMLINRFNAGLISVQSFMEALGETTEEIDRIADELENAVTAGIITKQSALLAQNTIQKEIQKEQMEMQAKQQQQQADIVNSTGVDAQGKAIPPPPGAAGPGAPAGPGGAGNSAQISTPANNNPGGGIMSQPGSGATTASPAGAVAQTAQNAGA